MSEEETMRSNKNVYEGYVAGKIYRKGDMKIRLDFNPTVEWHGVAWLFGGWRLTSFLLPH